MLDSCRQSAPPSARDAKTASTKKKVPEPSVTHLPFFTVLRTMQAEPFGTNQYESYFLDSLLALVQTAKKAKGKEEDGCGFQILDGRHLVADFTAGGKRLHWPAHAGWRHFV